MRYTKEIVLIFNSILHFSQASLFGNVPLLCKIQNPVVDLNPLDVEHVVSFLKSQHFVSEFKKGLCSQVKNIEKAFSEAEADSDELHLNVMEMIEKYGYEAEAHDVTTSDGYELTIHRIPGKGPAVLLIHPIAGSADDWITLGEKSLAFLLAAQGYDVWLGNNRGNKYSKKHESLSPECADFWDFSFDENARFDLPAMIDYILEESNKTQLAYVGHAQGSTEFLVLASELPEYNEKISVAVLLVPVAYGSHMRSPLFRLLALTGNLDYKLLRLLGMNSFASNEILTSAVTSLLCGNNALSKSLCSSLLPLIGGYELGQFDIKQLPVIMNHFPTGASVKQLQHFLQNINSGRFCKFDYGKKKNKEIYGCEINPDYELENILSTVVIFHGGNDWVANTTDVHHLIERLPNVAGKQFLPSYGHFTFIWGANAIREHVFEPAIEYIKKYQ